jgi:ATP-binding cassette subfamily C (CFTR/MRP) protein 1
LPLVGSSSASAEAFVSSSFWSAGFLGLFGFALQTTSPLVTRQILNFITASYNYSHGLSDVVPPGVGRGIGLAFALWAMQQSYSLLIAQFLNRSLITG